VQQLLQSCRGNWTTSRLPHRAERKVYPTGFFSQLCFFNQKLIHPELKPIKDLDVSKINLS